MLKSFPPQSLIVSLLAVILVVILAVLNFMGWLEPARTFLWRIFSPLLLFFQKVNGEVSQTFAFIFTLKDLGRENSQLKSENQFLLQQIVFLKEAARENELLRQRLGLQPEGKSNLVLARPLAYDPQLGQYFILNKGSRDGLAEGQAVVDSHNFLVGRVVEASRTSAKALLLTGPNFSVNALLQESRINGLVRGEHGVEVVLDMVPLDKQVRDDELVITSGLNDAMPKGLIIGWVAKAAATPPEIFQRITLRPAADLRTIEEVFVILSPLP